jgi:hypothetical protein
LKALSLQEPFATLVANGSKSIENRSWANAKVIGTRIAIHRSGADGAIIATAVVGGVVTTQVAEMICEEGQEKYISGPLCWLLGGVVKLKHPIPCSGKLGLWEVPPAILQDIEAQEKGGGKVKGKKGGKS